MVAPITQWKEYFAPNIWQVRLDPDPLNGLIKPSAVDTLQLRGLDELRFVKRMGEVGEADMEKIVLAIAAVTEFT